MSQLDPPAVAEQLNELNKSIPVRVEDIATENGWQIVRNRHDDPKAMALGFLLNSEDYSRVIGINQKISPRRQRYAVAHLLAHALLGHLEGRNIIFCYSLIVDPSEITKNIATPAQEQEAREAAMVMLMPESAVTALLTIEAGLAVSRDQLIDRMAARFEVSPEAMGYRLITLGLIGA